MIETFLISLMLVGIVPCALLVYFLVDLLAQPVYNSKIDKKPIKIEEIDDFGFEQISMPKKGK